MCGIAIAIGSPLGEDRVSETLASLRNRGPDASGVYCSKMRGLDITLLHTRLSIIDVEKRADQPMIGESCAVVFNGEIYNFVELRQQLQGLGCIFRTNSDTEVIIHAYRKWGVKCVERMEGMWSFVLLDEISQSIFVSRDRFGEKPLYYYEKSGTLFFASEVKALSAISGDRFTVNSSQISRFLVNGYRSLRKQNENFFEEVKEFPRATYALISTSQMEQQFCFWNLEYRPRQINRLQAIDEIKDCLIESLRIRLRADVPIAFCLSGGVDSTLLVAIANKVHHQQLHTFSIIDKDERYNESDNISATVKELNCDHSEIEISFDGFWDRMTSLIEYHDAPVATISYYVHSLLSEKIRSCGYKVAVSGTAADELFTGYYDHYNMWLAGEPKDDSFSQLLKDWHDGYGASVRNPILKDPLVFVENPEERRHIYLDRDKFNQLMKFTEKEDFSETKYCGNLLRNRMFNELFEEVVPVILHEDDRNSMFYSLENRSPYLDKRLVELAYSMPNQLLVKDGYLKSLLREVGVGMAPQEVLFDKRKRGFNASIETLVDINNSETRARLLEDGPIFDFLDRKKLEKFLTTGFQENSFSKFLFSFISSRIFLESSIFSR